MNFKFRSREFMLNGFIATLCALFLVSCDKSSTDFESDQISQTEAEKNLEPQMLTVEDCGKAGSLFGKVIG